MKKGFFCLLFLLLQSCAQIAPLKKDQAIDIESNFLATTYKQEGKLLNVYEVIDHISEKNPEKSIKLKFYSMFVPTMAASIVGGWMIGDGLVVNDFEDEADERMLCREC